MKSTYKQKTVLEAQWCYNLYGSKYCFERLLDWCRKSQSLSRSKESKSAEPYLSSVIHVCICVSETWTVTNAHETLLSAKYSTKKICSRPKKSSWRVKHNYELVNLYRSSEIET